MNGFVRKKVHSTTLGERLRGLRLCREIRLAEASRSTRIQAKYLEYLENGEYDKLPADVYTKGFIRNYAEYLGANPDKMVALFEKEKGIQTNLRRGHKTDQKKRKIKVSQFIVTPKIIGGIAIVAIVFGAFFYLYRSFENFVSTPRLVIKHPIRSHEVVNESHIVFEGVTDKDNELMINSKQVMVNDKGEFSEEISLQRGVNVVVVKAINRFDKETVKEFYVNSNIENTSDEAEYARQVRNENDKFEIEIRAQDVPVEISIKNGEEEIFSGTIHPGSNQKFRVDKGVTISSSDGHSTFLLVNGNERGLLSEEKKEVVDFLVDLEDNKKEDSSD